MPENDVTIKDTYNEKVNSKTGDHIFIYMSIIMSLFIKIKNIKIWF